MTTRASQSQWISRNLRKVFLSLLSKIPICFYRLVISDFNASIRIYKRLFSIPRALLGYPRLSRGTVIALLLATLAYRVSVKKNSSRSHRDQVIVIWKFEREKMMNETMYDLSMYAPHLICAANWATGFVATSQRRSFRKLCKTMLAKNYCSWGPKQNSVQKASLMEKAIHLAALKSINLDRYHWARRMVCMMRIA